MSVTNIKCEYIWLDGTSPTQSLRSKTKIVSCNLDEEKGLDLNLQDFPLWSFDGSSTNQADTTNSDCVLAPIFACIDPNRMGGVLVLCEVLNQDMTPHKTNTRANLIKTLVTAGEQAPVVGFEQEYFLYYEDHPLGWSDGPPAPQGPYYCSVGTGNVEGRELVEAHLTACLSSGLSIEGVNAEVALGQWEYQIGGPRVNAALACDQLWISRYLLSRMTEGANISVNWEPKPISGDWNGSGLHTNFSTATMRDKEGYHAVLDGVSKLESATDWIDYYGHGLEERLTGEHETCSLEEFRSGVADRSASVRIPWHVEVSKAGYFEDRRPNSNADPYKVVTFLVNTVCNPIPVI